VGALDPFDPGWRDLPFEVRQQAVDAATEPAQLARVAIGDPDTGLGLRAVAQICDDLLLADVSCSGARFAVADAALARVHAPAMLAKIAIESKYTYIRAGAVGRIHDRSLLADIAIRSLCTTTSRAAARRIRDRKLRAVVARQAVRGPARVAAAGHDAALLAEIAVRDPDPNTRRDAVMVVSDAALLARIARRDPDEIVRVAAVRLLNDTSVLTQVALEDPDRRVQTAAIGRIADRGILARVATSATHPEARGAATEKIKDEPVLVQIATEDPEAMVRCVAASRLTDQDVLTQIAYDDAAPHVRIAAIERMQRKGVLAQLARGDPNPDIRRAAINRLDDEALLAEIAERDPDEGLRQDAIGRLNDEEHLLRFLSHSDPAMRIAAAHRLLEIPSGRSSYDLFFRLERISRVQIAYGILADAMYDVDTSATERRKVRVTTEAAERTEARVLDRLASEHSSKAVRRSAIARLEELRTEQPEALGELVRDVALPGSLAATHQARRSRVAGAEPVDFSVFGPPAMAVGSTIMLQIFLHQPEQADEAVGLAKAFDAAAEPRGFRSLETDLELGSLVVFQVTLPKLEINAPLKRVVWRGRTVSVQFAVEAPEGLAAQTIVGKVHAIQDGIPVGHILFKLEVTERTPAADEQGLGDTALRYRCAFVCYASADRNEVLKRVQMLAIAGIEFFQDLLKLKPGQRWQRQLYRKIDESDLFLLFWSKSAKRSRWVLKEVRYAIARKGDDEEAPPEIVPVILGGPPPVKPPPDLAHLHFNDPIIYFMQ
jgi:TIR domain